MANIEIISKDINPWMGYVSLIWLRFSQGKFKELSRVFEWIKQGKKRYSLFCKAPIEASHVVLGLRINCEGSHIYSKKAHIEFQDLESKIIKVHSFIAPFLQFRSKLDLSSRSTIDLNIEIVSYCNLRCIWCSLDHSKPKRIMDPKMLEFILRQIISSRIPVRRIDLHNAGETLLHPAFEEMMRILGSARSSFNNFPYTALLTNGTTLDAETCKAILNNKAIDLLRFSIDGGTAHEFERIRKGAYWKPTKKNIERFIAMNNELKHPVATGIICMVDEKYPLTTEWMSKEFQEILSLVDLVEIRRPHHWDGTAKLNLPRHAREDGLCCFMENNNLVVLPNGDVTVCCVDLNSRGAIGTIEMGLTNILNCQKRKNMINMMKSGKRKKIPLCFNCNQLS